MAMKSGGDGELNAEINVTPMVDVMLVLLIIFMITAPMMNTGVEIDLPQVTAKQIEDPEGKLVLTIDAAKQITLGGTKIKWEELGAKLKSNDRVQKEGAIYIDAADTLQYGAVAKAMAVAKNAGVPKVMLLTDPEDDASLLKDLQKLDQGGAAPAGQNKPN
jgi:biopolymer transport protein TolR